MFNERISVRGLVMHQANGRSGLHLVCQFCDQFIDDTGLALMVWDPDGSEVLAVHKKCNQRDGDRYQFTQELGLMLVYLLWNSGLMDPDTLEDYQEIAREFMS